MYKENAINQKYTRSSNSMGIENRHIANIDNSIFQILCRKLRYILFNLFVYFNEDIST